MTGPEGGARLAPFADDLGDLLAEEFCAAGGRMANAVRIDTYFFQLNGGDGSQGDDLVARKHFQESPEQG